MVRRVIFAWLAIVCLIVTGCGSSPESSFELGQESRLPNWFKLPPGLNRTDVRVTMDYFIGSSGRTARFKLLDSKGRQIAEVLGAQMGAVPIVLSTPRTGFPAGYPSYEVITANGVTEIIEHRKLEPTFYVSDDGDVLAEIEAKLVGGGSKQGPQ
jgi:hypothetical protein